MAKNKRSKLILLDSHAIIHRAYHALPDFTSDTGESTGALYGLSAMLMKIIGDLKPDYIVAAYDLPEPTHRHEAFDEYKAGREKADDALVHQIERSRDVFKAFGIPIYEKPGFEADDILGTIVQKVKPKKQLDVVVASGDMDTLQLVDKKKVTVYTLKKGIKDTIIYDEKAVVERFGFTPTLLPDYKGLRGDPSDNIPGVPGVGEKTATALITGFGGIDDIYKRIENKEEDLLEKGITPRIVNLLKEHEEEARFSKMLAEIRVDAPVRFDIPKKTWAETVDSQDVVKLFGELGFRTLTARAKTMFGLNKISEDQISLNKDIPVSHSELAKTSLALWLISSDYTNPGQEDVLQYAKKQTFKEASKVVFKALEDHGLKDVYEKIEEPLIPVIKRLEETGVKIDLGYLKKLSKNYHKKLEIIEKKIFKLAGKEFNINSPKQMSSVLFDTLGIIGKGKTATGQRSTRESELQKMKDSHPIIEEILKYRELQKLLSTYIDNLPHMVSPGDGRLHAEFLQSGTTTGRISSRKPNLQNIPIRSELGKAVRNAFVCDKGFEMVAFDYSQIELRLAAILSGDKKMLSVFKRGDDIHSAVAKEIFGDSTPTSRRKAKIINFGILYGMGSSALARSAELTTKEAKAYLAEYFKGYSGLAEYIENTKLDTRKKGYTETLFGRRRYFPGIDSHLPYVRAEAERMAVNAPIQGTSADIIKIAMRDVDSLIEKEGLRKKVRLVLQVHDELVYEIESKALKDIAGKIKQLMERAAPKSNLKGVTLVVDASQGDNWGELKKLRN